MFLELLIHDHQSRPRPRLEHRFHGHCARLVLVVHRLNAGALGHLDDNVAHGDVVLDHGLGLGPLPAVLPTLIVDLRERARLNTDKLAGLKLDVDPPRARTLLRESVDHHALSVEVLRRGRRDAPNRGQVAHNQAVLAFGRGRPRPPLGRCQGAGANGDDLARFGEAHVETARRCVELLHLHLLAVEVGRALEALDDRQSTR
mmetsp:Transcript_17527/g.41142  ORF Transcript_17527/g.41142 Transcript_17527/m.41142 type:complete len:202 (+) Transcript_17527:684-1289(+)